MEVKVMLFFLLTVLILLYLMLMYSLSVVKDKMAEIERLERERERLVQRLEQRNITRWVK